MEKISWLDKVTNKEVLRRVNEDRQILNSTSQREHRWIGHVLRQDRLLHEITEGRMNGKPKEGGEFKCYMIWQMMVALLHSKRAAEDRQRDGNRERMSKACCTWCNLPSTLGTTASTLIKPQGRMSSTCEILTLRWYTVTQEYQQVDKCRPH